MKKQTIGMKIASFRREKGMTQLELAEKMGVTDKAVSKWERDLSCPDVSSIPKLADIFGISIDELMQEKAIPENAEEKKNVDELIMLILRGVAMAMGVAVVVLSLLAQFTKTQVDVNSVSGMLGIGLACVAVSLLAKKED